MLSPLLSNEASTTSRTYGKVVGWRHELLVLCSA